MNRRQMLGLTMGAVLQHAGKALAAPHSGAIPIVDCHIHLFDTGRPGGVPWPEKSDTVIYKPALPGRYERMVRPLGVVGAIAVEASPLPGDNDWVLQQAAAHPILVGMVGDLIPGEPSFPHQLERLRANSLFLGIRYGNLWNRDLFTDVKMPGFVPDLRRLAASGLEMDSANPDPRLIAGLLRVSDAVPELRMVIDHLPGAPAPVEPGALREYQSNLERLSQNPRVYVKLSEIPARVGARVRLDLPFYQQKLDAIWETFGEDRILYGSDWPNSDHLATYAETLGLVRSYVTAKGGTACEKFFWRNSVAAYQWRPRQPDQPAL